MYTRIANVLILILLTSSLMAQKKNTYDYATQWKKIEDLVSKKGQPLSALKLVDSIYAQAKKENNDAQLLKALMYKTQFNSSRDMSALKMDIASLEKELIGAKEPRASLLHSLIAAQYWNFFQQNRFVLYNRKTVQGNRSADIDTWSAEDLHATIAEHYLASLKNRTSLQSQKLSDFDPVIVKEGDRSLRPTLYDLLAHQALDYFTNPERTIQKPIDAFNLTDPKAFAPAKEFASATFNSNDSSSLELVSIRIYQELTRQHLNDKDPAALIDLELERLEYMNRTSVADSKKEIYIRALQMLSAHYPDRDDAAMARFLKLNMDHEDAQTYDPDQRRTANRFALVQVQKGLLELERSHPTSIAATMANNLRQQLEQKQIEVRTEEVNLPDHPFRAWVTFSNVKRMFYRIIPAMDENGRDDEDRWSKNYWARITDRKAIREAELELPAETDLRQHSVEIKIDGLPVGTYALLASTSEEFSPGSDALTLSRFAVTNIGWFSNNEHIFIVDRETGHPLPQAKVVVWQLKYDYNDRKKGQIKLGTLTADLDGHVRLPEYKTSEGSIKLEVSWKNDHYFPEQEQYFTYSPHNKAPSPDAAKYEAANRTIFFFTDRSIYRPGQTLQYKVLVATKDFTTKRYKILHDYSTKIRLLDANRQLVDSATVTTNEYGTAAGKFTLPEGRLTGQFSLTTDDLATVAYFRVEEYKRPRFFTELKSPGAEYRLNDDISIEGQAKAYAGNSLNGAKVTYRVTRSARYGSPYWGRGGWSPSPEQEIASGTTITDAQGKYSIQFKAKPDLTIPVADDPIFEYSVSADVTDLNGETRSARSMVSAGYRSLELSILIPRKGTIHFIDSINSVIVKATNLSGEERKTPYTLSIQRLKAPERLIRPRYWNAPDTFMLDREEYLKWFPHDEYGNEKDKTTWPKDAVLLSVNDTSGNDPRRLHVSGLKAGWYLFEAKANDRNGQPVATREYVQIFDPADLSTADRSQYFQAFASRTSLEVGEVARLQLASNADDIWMVQEKLNGEPSDLIKPIASPGKLAPASKKKPSAITSDQTDAQHPFTIIKISKGTTSFEVKAGEEDKGGLGFAHAFVKHNRFFSDLSSIDVPWTEKELHVKFTSFRDKTEPGSRENWTVSIHGSKGDKVAAELLASAYDASLDQFTAHAWQTPGLFPKKWVSSGWQGRTGFHSDEPEMYEQTLNSKPIKATQYEALIWRQSTYAYRSVVTARGISSMNMSSNLNEVVVTGYGIAMEDAATPQAAPVPHNKKTVEMVKFTPPKIVKDEDVEKEEETDTKSTPTASPLRTNFNETAFFYPDLHTDAEGNVQFSFTMPDALTQWKTQVFAHTKDLAMGMATQTIVTQKDLMVQPNAPRFLREGDRISFAAKVANLAEKEITGQAQLQLIDPETNEPVDGWFKNTFPVQFFTVAAGQSSAVKFEFEVPTNYNKPLRYRIIATSGNKSDGEEAELPVLSNRMLVTESMPILMKGDGTKTFSFDKLLKNGSPSLTHHALTVEYSANPAWYAVQSLPYLAEFPHECAEQLFNRFYANALAEKVLEKAPKIKTYYEQWAKDTTKNRGLISNLEKNPELKSVLLQETPWVTEAKNEADQKKNIAILFDLARLNKELNANLDKLAQAQSPNGGFTWFPGGPDDRFITQYIASSIGHLKALQSVPAAHKATIDRMQQTAITYLDQRTREDYDWLIRNKADLKKHQLSNLQVQYLYARSMAKEVHLTEKNKVAYDYYLSQASKFWLQHGRMEQGMIALVLSRSGDAKTANAIITSLKQYALQSPTLGMYWADNSNGYYWYDAPVETQALMIEAFAEVAHDEASVESMKQWLLTQKQTSNWKSTKATADAVYALLLQGQQWTAATPDVTIKLGDKGQQVVKSSPTDEAGTGYFKQVIEGKKVTENLGKVEVTVQHTAAKQALSWGSVYWQYFENLDAITPAASPFSIKKGLFLEKNTDKGPVNVPVENGAELKPGDKLIVRIEIRADRDMEYVHLKDMRASGTEPINVLSEYKWQGGLGYYESTRDASTNFFFSWMPKGTYVFEYPLFVSAEGNFSVGIAQAECMYAPEFSAHSEGLRIRVRE